MKLEEIKKLVDAATPGPLYVGRLGGSKEWCVELFTSPEPSLETGVATMWGIRPDGEARANGAFFAAARTLMPKLVKVAEAGKWAAKEWKGHGPAWTIYQPLLEDFYNALAELESE